MHPILLFVDDPSALSSYSSSSSSISCCTAAAFPLPPQGFFCSLALLLPLDCFPLSIISSIFSVSSSSSLSFALWVYLSARSFFSCSFHCFSSTSSCVNSTSSSNCSASSALFLCCSLCNATPILMFSLLNLVRMYFQGLLTGYCGGFRSSFSCNNSCSPSPIITKSGSLN